MIALVQRVSQARVFVGDKEVAQIANGLCVFLGIVAADSDADLKYMLDKITKLKFFADAGGRFEHNVKEAAAELLVVSQFTLCANLAKGSKPSFSKAMNPQAALAMYNNFCTELKMQGLSVKMGEFGAYMQVELTNEGPATFIINSHNETN